MEYKDKNNDNIKVISEWMGGAIRSIFVGYRARSNNFDVMCDQGITPITVMVMTKEIANDVKLYLESKHRVGTKSKNNE